VSLPAEPDPALWSLLCEAVVVADSGGRVVFANAAAEELFGVRGEPLIGRVAAELGTYVEDGGCPPFAFLAGGIPCEGVGRVLRIPGRPDAPVLVRQAALAGGAGAEILSPAADCRGLLELRTDLGSTLNHDIRAAVSAVVLGIEAAQTLGGENLPRHVLAFLERAQVACDRTLRLVSDAHDVARLEVGLTRLQREPVPLGRGIASGLEFVRGDADDAGITLDVRLHDVDRTVDADPDRFSRLVQNLAKAAVDASPRGGTVRIQSRDLPHGAIELAVRLTVLDGVPEEASRAFDPFRSPEVRERLKRLGSPCAFAFCRAVAVAHGWAISALADGPELEYRVVMADPGPDEGGPSPC